MSDGDDGTVDYCAEFAGEGDRTDGSRGDENRESGTGDSNRERIARRIREHAATVERRERETAVRKLQENGGITASQREAIEEMTDAIVDGLLATPEEALREADDRRLRAAMRVYGLDPDDLDGA